MAPGPFVVAAQAAHEVAAQAAHGVAAQADGETTPRMLLYRVALLVASFLFLLGLRGLSRPETARRGLQYAAVGMLLGVLGTLVHEDIVSYHWIILGLVVGTLIGIPMGLWIPMTKMPERIALSHAFGGLAVALVGLAEYITKGPEMGSFAMAAVTTEALLGSITFTGSLVAFGKLQGLLSGKPQTFVGQNTLNFVLIGAALAGIVTIVIQPDLSPVMFGLAGLGLLLGVLLVMPIGGADMPVVICLLNAYAGLAAAAAGFALDNEVLIICGALDGGSGIILALIMSKAMNRSFYNVLFGAFGSVSATVPGKAAAVREGAPEDAAELLKLAGSVIIVPGYGMAVAQAQHAVRDLANAMAANGTRVRFAVHPVAGRMPGHMNVLLAEANVPYDEVFELEDINSEFAQADAVYVIGANDVVNPAAEDDKTSPIYGMPVLQVWKSATVLFNKRSLASGYAGIDNPVFYRDNTVMVLGDAKKMTEDIGKAMAH